jgi:hypothetical protein
MAKFTYTPPGNLDDLAGRASREQFLVNWDQYILKAFRDNIGDLGDDPLFFTEADTPATTPAVRIPWNAFPLSLTRKVGAGVAAWKAADILQSTTGYTPPGAPKVTTQYRPQDEYCEWFAYITPGTTKISRIVFTAEGPEYWIKLAEADLDQVVALYQAYVDPQVKQSDLLLTADLQYDRDTVLAAGTYNPFNIWNTKKGVMHLTHPANTLGAEINLAAVASQTVKDNTGARVTDVRRLVCCAGYGDANRSSDPLIGWNVNTTCVPIAAGGAVLDATLADPVALYMDGLQPGFLTGPSGESLDGWFQFRRGAPGKGLLAVLEAPAGAGFGLDQVLVKGVPLTRGGQIAEIINMVLYAKAKPHTGNAPSLVGCTSHCCMPAGTAPAKIPSTNLNQPRDRNTGLAAPCRNGDVNAYPEITATGAPQKKAAEEASHGVRKTRLGGQ